MPLPISTVLLSFLPLCYAHGSAPSTTLCGYDALAGTSLLPPHHLFGCAHYQPTFLSLLASLHNARLRFLPGRYRTFRGTISSPPFLHFIVRFVLAGVVLRALPLPLVDAPAHRYPSGTWPSLLPAPFQEGHVFCLPTCATWVLASWRLPPSAPHAYGACNHSTTLLSTICGQGSHPTRLNKLSGLPHVGCDTSRAALHCHYMATCLVSLTKHWLSIHPFTWEEALPSLQTPT